MKVIQAVFFMLCSGAFAVKFPTDIPKCKKGDSECMIKSANIVMNIYAKGGERGIALLPLDPLDIPKINIEQGEESPVNVVLKFSNNTITGLKDFTFYKIEGFNDKPEGKYEIRLKGPRLELVGPYSIQGRILILPISGIGQSNITVVDPDFLVRFNGKTVTKNGKTYLKPENTKLSFTLTKMSLYLSNLYNGDKALGDNTNLFLNENWQEVWPEIKKSVFLAFGQIVDNILSNIFTRVPYDDLFDNSGKSP
ncbi:protein takeout-like [Contarinia nasturtii]|uniref:protein takeout-like n=1 Tax=Contarinia nasturtii TaxID=265458 RepID=UPI0012D38B31|nr:protein takeout-like [Contarinia nasturtii]XP_031627224.1 protein takeout-like [Contarinia nasturtii]XP_031627225.1 protein takeout-like [Contarinia nasturtii]XP_031627226.1 protein takeout-like [Contarinia nasturtii]XP_031627227.1 protein takeout-like [Contarinia nasturtii]